MKVFYDFHIHSALSPCADDDNTPYNIVNMAALNGLGAIAVTDHNSVKNCRAAVYAGKKKGVLVVPGMELTTSEDIHILCLFADIDGAEAFEKFIQKDMLKIKNNVKVFGRQLIYGEHDNITGEEETLLSVATGVPSYRAADVIKPYGGIALPAHINREANGIIAALGCIDKSMGFTAAEFTGCADDKIKGFDSENYIVLRDSDAHSLYLINSASNFIDIPKKTAGEIVKFLSNK